MNIRIYVLFAIKIAQLAMVAVLIALIVNQIIF
jgi:hypothetical protein